MTPVFITAKWVKLPHNCTSQRPATFLVYSQHSSGLLRDAVLLAFCLSDTLLGMVHCQLEDTKYTWSSRVTQCTWSVEWCTANTHSLITVSAFISLHYSLCQLQTFCPLGRDNVFTSEQLRATPHRGVYNNCHCATLVFSLQLSIITMSYCTSNAKKKDRFITSIFLEYEGQIHSMSLHKIASSPIMNNHIHSSRDDYLHSTKWNVNYSKREKEMCWCWTGQAVKDWKTVLWLADGPTTFLQQLTLVFLYIVLHHKPILHTKYISSSDFVEKMHI